ncbi:hypothetical protein OEZ85_014227 [Tetradesmus obliquus]|uniref:ABC transmembrane type-1 domain-containing protein n=1 Tax=Tetradesmus obliquus TaxID=3088 RepID=A0ABY8U7C6_TETOB|nr:hypothetical protein OEZ85_014227 [Tetradesmus obliquus]
MGVAHMSFRLGGVMCLLACVTALRYDPPYNSEHIILSSRVAEPSAVPSLGGHTSAAAATVDFDFFLLAQFNPPAYVPVAAQSRAKHAIVRHEAFPGFWTHGLWPVSHDVTILEYCSTEALQPGQLQGFEPGLRYYLRSGNLRFDTAGDQQLWAHEWLRHGTCSNMSQLEYFMAVFRASAAADPAAALRAAGIRPSNSKPYTQQAITSALAASFGVAFNQHIGLRCAPSAADASRLELQEVRLCLSRSGFSRYNCSKYAEWVKPGIKLDSCGADPSTPVWLLDYDDSEAGISFPWRLLGTFGGAALLLAAALAAGYLALRSANKLPSVFTPRQVQLVHYNLVHMPVKILAEPLDMAVLWQRVPYIAEFVEDLPVGMGIKGGIARKLLKELYGTPEPSGSFDIDVAVFIKEYTYEDRKAARELVTGLRMGGLVLEAKDVEVLTKSWLYEYFTSRDVTMNEVLIIKQGPGQALFYYTRDALRDVQLQLIRPCVHTLKSEYNLNWAVEDDGTPYTSSSQLCRCIVRYLKGHGTDYALDPATWAHYRREKLTKLQLFKVLRHFHDDSVKLQAAVDHLIDIGFMSRRDVLRAGGVNMLWGLLLQDVNAAIVAANAGTRLTLGELDAAGVEAWVDGKKAQVASKLIALEMRGRRTGFMPAYGGVQELGLLQAPEELKQFIATGPTFDPSAALESEAAAAISQLSPEQPGGAASDPQAILSKRMWSTQRAVTQASSDALLSLAQHKFSLPSAAASPAAARLLGTSPKLAELLTSPEADSPPQQGQLESSGQSHQDKASPDAHSARRLGHLSSLKKLAAGRQNKAYKQSSGAQASGGSFSRSSSTTIQEAAEASSSSGSSSTTPAPAASTAAANEEDAAEAGHGIVWLRYSEVGRFSQPDDLAQAKLGTFYQVLDAASGLEGEGDKQYTELIANDQRPQRQRPAISRLLSFAAGVAAMNVPLLAAAYSLLLLAMVFRLAVPKVEGAIFDAFNSFDMPGFRNDLLLAVVLVGADVVLSVGGHVVLELFARKTMSSLFASFFDHILGQELTFFSRLPAGELMARTSGDSLTLRSMFTSTAYQLVEGATLLMGAAGCLLVSLGPLWLRAPSLGMALLLGLMLSGMEGFLTGLGARALNLRVRQSLGRMFGFSLDIFSKMDAVGTLGLEARLTADYKCFAADYFSNTFKLNTLLALHKSYTYALAACVRAAMLWFGGVALFADLMTVGTLFTMLRYATIMQRGVKQASDAYARVMASVGSLERVVELHDRGVFRDAAKSLGKEEFPIVEESEDEGGEEPEQTARSSTWAGRGNGGSSKAALQQPLLQKLAGPWKQQKPKVRVQLLPEEQRPGFGAMLGGVQLEEIFLTLRSKTDRLVLKDASMTVAAGKAVIITSGPGGGKSSLLQLIMLRHMPYKGYVSFQLPLSAAPTAAAGASSPILNGASNSNIDSSSSVDPAAAEALAGAAAHAAAAAAAMGPGVKPGGEGWVWASFSWLKDDQQAARACMAMASVSAAGLFRTTVEDNVACASMQPVSCADVREACKQVGAHEFIMALPEGYRTLVGDGSGTIVSPALLLKLALARALVRRPRLLLLDDAEQFADAVGRSRLLGILAAQQAAGVTILLACDSPAAFSSITRTVYAIEEGTLHLQGP